MFPENYWSTMGHHEFRRYLARRVSWTLGRDLRPLYDAVARRHDITTFEPEQVAELVCEADKGLAVDKATAADVAEAAELLRAAERAVLDAPIGGASLPFEMWATARAAYTRLVGLVAEAKEAVPLFLA